MLGTEQRTRRKDKHHTKKISSEHPWMAQKQLDINDKLCEKNSITRMVNKDSTQKTQIFWTCSKIAK